MLSDPTTQPSPLIAATARAYGMARLIRTRAISLARGREPFPQPTGADPSAQMARARSELSAARSLWRTARGKERCACLPLAVVGPYLDATERMGHERSRALVEIMPLTRVWRLYAAHALGWC